jgi:hypothetical protein
MEDGRSADGGIGILIDTAGDDSYSAQVFCQGTGFLGGIGMLFDGEGSDRYRGVWYAQASAAHEAVGILVDCGDGDDRYLAERTTAIAAAHDFSVAMLYDEGGDDAYKTGAFGLGGVNQNGVAIFVDRSGDDTYAMSSAPPFGLGNARLDTYGNWREVVIGAGFFFDLGGDDTYACKKSRARNDAIWEGSRLHPDLDLICEKGVGIDGDYPNSFRCRLQTEPGPGEAKQREDAIAARRQYRESIDRGEGPIRSVRSGKE